MPIDLRPRMAMVRPGRAAQEWLRQAIAELQTDDPFAPVTVIAPNYYAGRQARWLIANHGGYLNVRSMLLGDVAAIIAPLIERPPLTAVLEESAVRAAVAHVNNALLPLTHHRSLHASLVRLFRELRRQEAMIGAPPNEMARAALDAYAVFRAITGGYADRTRLREIATERLQAASEAPAAVREIGACIVWLPPRLDPADARLLAGLARWTPVRAAFAAFGGGGGEDELANGPGARAATELGAALAAVGVAGHPAVSATTGHVNAIKADVSVTTIDVSVTTAEPGGPALRVIRAPDPAEEVREVLRAVARDLDASVPLHHIAVLYRQADPYASLLRDSLSQAALPWSALEGRTLAESRPGRALLALLQIPQRDFAREAVLGWIDAAPRPPAGLPGSAWDRLSRAANIVRSAAQWQARLDNFAARQRELATQRELQAQPAAGLRYEADAAERMRATVAALADDLRPPPDGSAWGEFVGWAENLWRTYCGAARSWSADERAFAEEVARTLADLRQADILEADSGTLLTLFLDTVRDALEGRARPVGSLGQGVLVGPVQSVTGLAFERVYVVGMTEGAFPTPPPGDPFFPSAAEDPLGLRERYRQAERMAFMTAVAAADGGTLVLSVPDSIGGRKAFPSPWLLEQAASVSGQPLLLTSAFHSMHQTTDQHPWLRVVASAIDGVCQSPPLVDLEDRRLRSAATTGDLRRQPIAAREDLPLRAGLVANSARASAEFSAFDGNVADLVVDAPDLARVMASAQHISASGIEAWAACPFQFFVGRVLRVQSTDRPEDGWSVDPLERGSLIHDILEQFFRRLQGAGRLDNLRQYTPADHALLQALAEERFAELERRGVTGHPLVWENTAAVIRADLRSFLVKDERWRREAGLRPVFFEQPFGTQDPQTWPALELQFAGRSVRLRGYIDRVDLDHSGRRAFLYDYKTGGTSSYGDMDTDPLMAGKHVQLALYRRAVLAALPDVEEVDGAYWFVSSRGEFKMLRLGAAARDADQRLTEILEVTERGILGGVFPQVPGDETVRPGRFSWENCAYCPFDRVCPAGRDAVFDRKQGAPGYALHAGLALATTRATEGDV